MFSRVPRPSGAPSLVQHLTSSRGSGVSDAPVNTPVVPGGPSADRPAADAGAVAGGVTAAAADGGSD